MAPREGPASIRFPTGMGAPEPKRISIEEARRLVSERVAGLEGEEVALDDALGRVLAQDGVALVGGEPVDIEFVG